MISEIIEKWIKGILIDGITGNLSGLFDNVNAKVGEIASDVGSTPQAWNSGIFNMLRSLSETVVLPIAAAILALVMCHELIQMITEKNNIRQISRDTHCLFRMWWCCTRTDKIPLTTAIVWAFSRCQSSCEKIRCAPQSFPRNKTKI